MENYNSYGTSWADQWDYDQDTAPATKNRSTATLGGGSAAAKYKQKLGEGLGKTKTVATHGVKKVKGGTVVGFQWIKNKYHKTTQKH